MCDLPQCCLRPSSRLPWICVLAYRPFSARVYSVWRGVYSCLCPSVSLSLWDKVFCEAGLKSALFKSSHIKLALLRFFYLHLYTQFVHMPRPFLCRPFTCVEFWLGFLWYVCSGSIFIPNNILLGILFPKVCLSWSVLVHGTAGFVGLFWIVCLPPPHVRSLIGCFTPCWDIRKSLYIQ